MILDGASLTLAEVVAVARHGATVELADEARERMRPAFTVVRRVLAEDRQAVCGLTTGVGVRKRVRIPAAERPRTTRRFIAEHRVAQGPPVTDDIVRATTLRLANGFARGSAGVRPELVVPLLDALNAGARPPVRPLGSLGVADLGPLADLAAGLVGDLELEPKEALARQRERVLDRSRGPRRGRRGTARGLHATGRGARSGGLRRQPVTARPGGPATARSSGIRCRFAAPRPCWAPPARRCATSAGCSPSS